MADPLSLIALGAAVGGAAGKFAEKAWDSGERWLRERFGSHAAEAQEQARENAARFVQQLAIRVKSLEDQKKLNRERIAATEKHPQFSALLQGSILNAAQTDDDMKHDLLARLVATRLASVSESTVALASQLASDAISRSTRRQLMLMALSSFLEKDVRPRDPLSVPDYRRWLEVFLQPFIDFEFKDIDARHLVAIACASYDPTSNRDLEVLLQMKGGEHCIGATLHDLDVVKILQMQWYEGLAGLILTSVGSIVGSLAFNQIKGRDYGLPQWD